MILMVEGFWLVVDFIKIINELLWWLLWKKIYWMFKLFDC